MNPVQTHEPAALPYANQVEPYGISYPDYLDKVLGGWLGKSIGGTVGARFEGRKEWIEADPDALFPDTVPPNDDLDLQVLWLKVLEEKGAALTSDDLAQAWVDWCWYPFCEYGVFRRNWRLGIRPPMSGRYGNQFWENGMGCPIRSEIWGYVFPGRPDLAAQYAGIDGSLDHANQSIGAEQWFAAMAADAFFESDIRLLMLRHLHYLPEGSRVRRGVDIAFAAFDAGLTLFDARARLSALNGFPEACDAQINVPIIALSLLYGRNDLEQTLLSALRCGYDTDCTMATACAFIGQILGAAALPEAFTRPIGDELVMGIAYHRDDMTISGLSRDTARMGVLLAADTGVSIPDAPAFEPLPDTAVRPETSLSVEYDGLPCAAPGETVRVTVRVQGTVENGQTLSVETPEGWRAEPARAVLDPGAHEATFALHAPENPDMWPVKNLFTARLDDAAELRFGIAGAGLWRLLGMHHHLDPPEDVPHKAQRAWHHHFTSIDRDYLPEPDLDVRALHTECSRILGFEALVVSRENEINLDALLGLSGPYCAYLARTIVAPKAHQTHIVVGNTDSFRIYLNGKLVGERDEHIWWTPQNNSYLVDLDEGPNLLVVKLIKQDSPSWRFTLGFRPHEGPKAPQGQHFLDWDTDLADGPI